MPLTAEQVRALEPILRVVARRTVNNRAMCEDLVQETLLAALTNLATFDGRCELRSWVIGILSHKTIDHFRKERRWQSEDAETSQDPRVFAPSTRTPESELSDKQSLHILERALHELKEQERMAVVLCDVEGLPREEVCNVLGVQATHLRVLLHRARHQLRKALEDADM